jgi:hypothetical protein
MRKSILTFTSILLINFLGFSQNVFFTLSNTAKFLKQNSNDTLKYPFVGGFQKPQFSKIDLNNDNIKDLVVFDGIGNKVFTYLWQNNSWVYAPQFEKSFPPLSQWLKLIDFNCDGKEDIFSAGGTGFTINPGEFVGATTVRYFQNTSTSTAISFKQIVNCLNHNYEGIDDCIEYNPSDVGVIDDINGDGKIDIIQSPASSNYFNLFLNKRPSGNNFCDSIDFGLKVINWGHFSYKLVANGFNLHQPASYLFKGGKHLSNSFAVFDYDADGDKDFIYGDGFYPTLIYCKNGKELSPLGRDSMIAEDTIFPRNTYVPKDIIWPTPYFEDFDNDGVKDMVITTNEPATVKNTNQVYLYKNTAANSTLPANFQFVKENFLQDEMIDLGGNSKPVFVDIDNDNDQDIIVATQGNYLSTKNGYDLLYLFKNIGGVNNPVYSLVDTNFANIQQGVTLNLTNVVPTFGDLNGDGKKDMILGWYNGYLNYFENTSVGSNIAFTKRDSNYFKIDVGTETAPQLVDLNKDGKLDLVIGKRNGTLAYFENTGTVTSPIFSAIPTNDSLGKINVRSREDTYGNAIPCLYDLDNDGIFEALVGSYSKSVILYTDITPNKNIIARRIGNIFKDNSTMAADSIMQGIYTSVSIANIDNDSSPEVLIGNQRGGFRFYKSTITGKISLAANNDLYNKSFKANIYPNPAKNYLIIETDLVHENAEISLINILGSTILNQTIAKENNETKLELQNIKPGIYFVKIQTETGKQLVQRVVIE